MTKNSAVTLLLAAGLLVAADAVVFEDAAHAQSSTAGAVRGIIRDKASGEPMIGATVVATSSALQGQQAQITDENGSYVIDNLPPGTYVITVYYNDAQFSRGNVLIQVGKQSVVNVPIDTAAATSGETIVIEGRAPVVDQGSTKTGVTITDEYTQNIPVGRTFGAVLGSAAGSQGDTYGQSFSGSSSAENTYIVEGINTTDTGYGTQASNLPNEFIQETEVITGGYNAEFGRSTGAVVNVVTKSGGNDFKGSVFSYYTPGALTLESDPIPSNRSAITGVGNLDYALDLGAWLGGPILKDKLWFSVGFNPQFRTTNVDRIIFSRVDRLDNATLQPVAGGDGQPDLDPETGFRITEEVGRRELSYSSSTYYFTGKISGALSPDHQFQIAGFGNPRRAEDQGALTGTQSAERIKASDGAYDGSLKWTSKFADGNTQIDAVAGFHRQIDNGDPVNAAGGAPRVRFDYVRPLSDFEMVEPNLPAQCRDSMDASQDPYPGIVNCPVNRYGLGGLGFLENRTNDRISGVLGLTQRVKAAGYHTFKVGADIEQTTFDDQRYYTGTTFFRQFSDQSWETREFVTFVNDPNAELTCGADLDGDGMGDSHCKKVDSLAADTTNRNLAAYLQDSWQIQPNLTLNAGIRWEQQTAFTAEFLQGTKTPEGETIPDEAFKLSNMWAPRLGLIYDPTKEGRSKIYGHWGRFYESIPMDINVRAFGGELTNFQALNGGGAPACDGGNAPTGMPVDPDVANSVQNCARSTPEILGGSTSYVQPNLEAQYMNEYILGAEYELMSDFKVGLSYIHRDLPIIIEDISTDGGNNYLIANPGTDHHAEAEALRKQAEGITDNDPLKNLYLSRASQLDAVGLYDQPVRNYDGVQLTATQRFSKAAMLIASYTYSRSKGNFPGLFSTETGQLDPNLTSMFDLPDLMANRYGAMAHDRPHLLKVDGFYQFDLKKAGVVILGASFRGQSGQGVNTLGGSSHPGYTIDESYLLPRGAIARTPFTWTSDVKAQYGYRFGDGTQVTAFVDVFNVTNNQKEVDRDESYTSSAMNPIVGGTPEDLAHGKTVTLSGAARGTQQNQTAELNPNFGHMTAHQAPMSFRFGIRLDF